jgi:hypothetical protein
MAGWVSGPDLATSAQAYARRMSWPVAQGTWLTPRRACSCGESGCARPGGHPLSVAWSLEATRDAEILGRLWDRRPQAGVLVPTGYAFDAIDMPAEAGREALHRLREMGYRLGPVAATDERRMLIFVEVADRQPAECAAGPVGRPWRYAELDVYLATQGSYVMLPPSPGVRWVIPPRPLERRGRLPRVEELIGAIAAVCLELRGGPAVALHAAGAV